MKKCEIVKINRQDFVQRKVMVLLHSSIYPNITSVNDALLFIADEMLFISYRQVTRIYNRTH